MQSKTKQSAAEGTRNNIYQNPRLRLKGWRAALRSPRTPKWRRAGIRENIRRLEARLRKGKRGVK
jgi:hypothetical protein